MSFFCALSPQLKRELLLVTSPVRVFLHFVFSRCLKDAFPKRSLLCVDPALSMLCCQNSGENCSTRFRVGEASHLPPPTSSSCDPDVTLDCYYVLVCCWLKVLPPKEIKETEIEEYRSLKGERLGKKMCGCPHEKIEDAFVMQLWILTVFELCKFLKLNATIIYTVFSLLAWQINV